MRRLFRFYVRQPIFSEFVNDSGQVSSNGTPSRSIRGGTMAAQGADHMRKALLPNRCSRQKGQREDCPRAALALFAALEILTEQTTARHSGGPEQPRKKSKPS